MVKANMDIKVQRIHRLANNAYVKAFADIIINDALLIKSIKIVNGKQGLFVAMPQEQAKDKKWYDRIRCLNEDIKELISMQVLAAYEADTDK